MSKSDSHVTQADARQIQRFLEEAAPIVLQSRVLDDQSLTKLLALAEQFGVSPAQLSDELQWLKQRGVITAAPWHRLPEKPSRSDRSTPADDRAETEAGRPDPARVTPPHPANAPKPRSGPPPVRSPENRPTPAQTAPTSDDQPIAARHQQVASPAAESTAPRNALDRTSLPPIDAFRNWLAQELDHYPSAILAMEDEQGLVGVGVHRHHLADVLARHLVRDVAMEHRIRLARDLEGASEHSTVDTTAPAADPNKLKLFFDQAAPVLAVHRGITPQSRVLLNAIAQQLEMTEEELDLAITQLQQSYGQQTEDPQQIERRDSFRAYLSRTLAQIPEGIITFKTLQRLEEAGEYFHGVAPQWILPTIREVASEIGIRFISKQQAVEHLETLIDDAWERGQSITRAIRVRIYAEGTRWGLDPMDVEASLHDRIRHNKQQRATERRRTRQLLMLTGITLVTILGLLGWMFQLDPDGPSGQVISADPQTQPVIAPRKKRAPWWSDDLRIAIASARVSMPDKKSLFADLESDRSSDRSQAYQQLVQTCRNSINRPTEREPIEQLLVGLYTCEPDDAVAGQLVDTLLEEVTALDKRPPDRPESIASMFWACEQAVRMWTSAGLSAQRATEIGARLVSAVAAPLRRHQQPESLRKACGAGLAKRLYTSLTANIDDMGEQTEPFHAALAEESIEYLEQDQQDQLDVAFLAAALPEAGERWPAYHDTIASLAQTRDPNTVLALLKIYKRVTDPLLEAFLTHELATRIGAESDAMTRDMVITAVRKSLGLADKMAASARWTELTAQARTQLADVPVESAHSEVLMEKTVDLAYLSTLACALTQGELGIAAYESLKSDGPPKLDKTIGPWATGATSPMTFESPVRQVTFAEQCIRDLGRTQSPTQRNRLLRIIMNYAERIPDISSEAGLALAKYFSEPKSDEAEREQVLKVAEPLGRSNAVRLALADQLINWKNRSVEYREQVYSAVLGKPISLKTEEDRRSVRRSLLLSVASSLRVSVEPTKSQFHIYDQATRAITDLYRSQARALGIPPEKYESVRRPAPILTLLINQAASQLTTKSLNDSDRRFIARLPYELEASRYVAEDDLQYTVLLEYLRLRTLAINLAQHHADLATAIHQKLAEVQQISRRTRHILEQYRQLQAACLELWMLTQPTEDADDV